MSDGSRESLTVLGLLPVWKLRPSFQPESAREAKQDEQGGQQGGPQAHGAVSFVVIATTPKAQILWQQIVLAARGLTFLHAAMSEAVVLTIAQRDRLQSIVHDSPSGTCFSILGEPELAKDFKALIAESSGHSVLTLPPLWRLLEGPAAKRECWVRLVALNRGLSG